jgi:hypothetical protein
VQQALSITMQLGSAAARLAALVGVSTLTANDPMVAANFAGR